MSLVRGNVRFFDEEKGFGFIAVEEGREKGRDVFVHASDVKGDPIRDGDDVEFYVEEDERKRGSLRASEVTGGSGRPGERGRGGDKGGRSGGFGDSGKGGGKGGQTRKPGDWDCGCGFMNFASRNDCMKCGKPKARGGRDSRSRSRGGERGGRRDSRRR